MKKSIPINSGSGLARFVMTVAQGMAVQAKAGVTKDALDAIMKDVLATWPSSPRAAGA